jgi:hypothetical protein
VVRSADPAGKLGRKSKAPRDAGGIVRIHRGVSLSGPAAISAAILAAKFILRQSYQKGVSGNASPRARDNHP